MKILIVTDEEWNDYVYGNGVLTNWFAGFDAEFAQIYCSPGKPVNQICDRYFQITDAQMVKSMFGLYKAGGRIYKDDKAECIEANKQNAQRQGIYGVMKKISLWMRIPVVMVRDFIWHFGRYDTDALRSFVEEFKPDVVFCPRYVSPKLMRLEQIVAKFTDAPFIAWTGDDELLVLKKTFAPLYYIRNHYILRMFAKHVSLYSHYLTFSEDQAREYRQMYGVKTDVLYKCGDFPEKFIAKEVGTPIRMVYAGRLYCNRWKSLAEIGKALQIINKDGVRMVLDIYTTEQLTPAQRKALSEDKYIYVKGRVAPSELVEIYRKADIALHVESMDRKNRLLTRVSFSTKIIDLMASTCAIMAICWEKHTGYQYLKEKDAAFCISRYEDILTQLQGICNQPSLISQYAEKAYNCGKSNHSRETIHNRIKRIFENVISEKRINRY